MSYFITESESASSTSSSSRPKTAYRRVSGLVSGHRYFSPEIGRWISRDPIGELGFESIPMTVAFIDSPTPLMENGDKGLAAQLEPLYAHTHNDPINSFDVLGLACGSGWSEWLVPDKPGGFPFESPCQNHDDCYGDKGCKAGKTKAECDKGLRDDAMKVCATQPEKVRDICAIPGGKGSVPCWRYPRKQCEGFANLYYSAVRKLGQGPFDSARKTCCPPKGNTP